MQPDWIKTFMTRVEILDDAGPYSIIDEHDRHEGLFAVLQFPMDLTRAKG